MRSIIKLLICYSINLIHIALIADGVSAVSIKEHPYLYTENAGPIAEHQAPDGDRMRHLDQPDFLYDPSNSNYRVVEFYVHWCGVCRHYSNHFIKFARKVDSLAKEKNVPMTFHTISCVPNKSLCRKQKADAFPLIRLLKPGETEGIDLKHYEAEPNRVFRELGIDRTGLNFEDEIEKDWDVSTPLHLGSRATKSEGPWWRPLSGLFFGSNETDSDDANTHAHETHFIARSREDLKNDIHLSFDFAMRNNVFMAEQDHLPEEKADALFEWLALLKKTLPASWTEMHVLLTQLIRNFRYITKKESYVMKILDKHPPKATQWSESCSKREPGQGFTCGLWEIIHAATVGVLPFNRNAVVQKHLLVPSAVAKTIRDYIEYFFHCDDCRRNFLTMFDSCGHDHCNRLKTKTKLGLVEATLDWEQPALFFYEVHNAVNVRLMKEKAAREEWEPSRQNELDVQWPPQYECRPCWKQDANGNLLWEDKMVIQYLRLEYGIRDSEIATFRKQLAEMNSKLMEEEHKRDSALEENPAAPSAVLQEFLFLNCIIGLVVVVLTAQKHRKRKLQTRKQVGSSKAAGKPPLPPRNKKKFLL